jgi:hypothetical protein
MKHTASWAIVGALAVAAGWSPGIEGVSAAATPRAPSGPTSGVSSGSAHRASGSTPRAPSGPPLTVDSIGTSETQGTAGTSEAQSAQSFAGGDPLVENGLGSPMCHPLAGSGSGGVSAQVQSNCRTSGWVAAAAPTSNYAFDVHAGGGLLGFGPQSLYQEYLLAPVWMGLVWVVHALLSMLEWAYTLDLIDSPTQSGLGQGLRATQASFTQPWLILALAIASVGAAYHGLVRRRVAETVGEVLLMAAMMLGGLWTIADPTGTVGVAGRLADQASLGALSAIAQGNPSDGTQTFTDGMRAVFADAIEGPWCYLEFGNVQWCRDPGQLDPRLRSAGLRLAVGEQGLVGCKLNSGPLSICVPVGSAQARAYSRSAELLRAAQTNGELFLALPAGGAPRNSTVGSSGLLSVLCGGGEVGSCRGPTAAQAEFRGSGGTEARTAGLLLIAVGGLGMVLLLGFLALHLLAAALMSLFYLLLAPAAVLAPALGDGGRAAFRGWATRLLGAIVAKLLYSLVLGATLAMERILLSLPGLGWWAQWLLVCAAWWGAFLHRHRALGVVQGGRRRPVLLQRVAVRP